MLKVGIAGYGVVGKQRHACIDRHPNLELVAVCDRTLNSNTVGDGIRQCSSYEQLLKEDLDVLIICMTNDVAAEVTCAGLELGMHVFCEKPPGRDVQDIKRVIETELKYPNLKLMYGFNHRYHDSVIEALRMIRSKELGSVINLRGVYGKSKLITFNQPDWRTQREIAGGGVLLDQGIHMVDLIRLFGGDFHEVQSIISNSHWGFDVEDNAYALLRSTTGAIAMLNSSATQWRHRFNLDINLERGSLILEGILTGSKSYGSETLTIVKVDHDHDHGDPNEQTITYDTDTSWDREIQYFEQCIIDKRAITSGSSNDALETMKLVFRIYFADQQWRNQYGIADPNI